MSKKDVMYVWTEKTEKIYPGARKAGQTATALGRPLPPGELANSWLKAGMVKEVAADGGK